MKDSREIFPTEYFGQDAPNRGLTAFYSAVSRHYQNSPPQKIVYIPHNAQTTPIYYFVGDLHGAFGDLQRIVRYLVPILDQAAGQRQTVKIIFLGDYVDRNALDLHTLTLLFAFYLKYPANVVVLRGNHEERLVNRRYGFKKTVLAHFSFHTYTIIQRVFARLPVAAVMHLSECGQIVALHGGVPIDIEDGAEPVILHEMSSHTFTSNLRKMDPITQQILWNDPSENLPPGMSFYPNRERSGTFFEFSEAIFREFMEANGFDLMVRGHQVFSQGYHFYFHRQLLSLYSGTEYDFQHIDGKIAKIVCGDGVGGPDIEIELLATKNL